ncbi:DUF4177 domain-containing protein [Natronosalvus rutilus]|nr:DUF4177 domain-containing protein [Natronosalvus rutilus]
MHEHAVPSSVIARRAIASQQSHHRESRYQLVGTKMHQQWEYKTLEPPKGLTKRETVDPTDELNRLGEEGWELTATISYDGGGTKLLLFKRPVTHE